MRLTIEIKQYIRDRLNVLVPEPYQKQMLVDLENEAHSLESEAAVQIQAVLDAVTEEFIKTHPVASGCEFEIYRVNPLQIKLYTHTCTLDSDLKEAQRQRNQLIEQLVAMAQIDATSCTNSIELDEVLVKLANR